MASEIKTIWKQNGAKKDYILMSVKKVKAFAGISLGGCSKINSDINKKKKKKKKRRKEGRNAHNVSILQKCKENELCKYRQTEVTDAHTCELRMGMQKMVISIF